ncbi:IPT/TIG domain-containing protein [Flavihumibacter fluvii]|uniref:NHL domain-containing protein n=1 Tax=Flavihumibacter fluvii TaxID=2838157 RepID=UPI001BDEB120|nr:IPT/TIG domain-containing protein [Flavihumibacter fluvii]ULQ51931.1 hypothetical protein KJS93_17720 [Flavihumibacter fluvii]
MKKSNQVLLSVLIIFLFLFSCSKDSSDPVINPAAVRIDKSSITFPSDESIDSFTVTATGPWTISKPADANWVQLSTMSGGAGTTKVFINVPDNSANAVQTVTLNINSQATPESQTTLTIKQTNEMNVIWFSNNRAPGGGSINILGHGFSPYPSGNTVTINGINAFVTSATTQNLVVTVPDMAGTGPIVVTTGSVKDTAKGDFIYEWIGIATVIAGGIDGYRDGQGENAQFSRPFGIDIDGDNTIYVADYGNSKIRKITPEGLVTTLPGRIPAWNNSTGPNTDFSLPNDVAVDANGNVFVLEVQSNGVSKITPGGEVSLYAGGTGSGFKDGPASTALFNSSNYLSADKDGNLYLADRNNAAIRKISTGGMVTTLAGGQQGYQNGAGTAAMFSLPIAIDIDAVGNLFVTDDNNHRIRKVTAGGMVSTFAGNGNYSWVDGEALSVASFTSPQCLAVAPDGTVYVSEPGYSDMIRKINPGGKVDTITKYFEEATGAAFELRGIFGMTVGTNGVLYVADTYHHRIVKIAYK